MTKFTDLSNLVWKKRQFIRTRKRWVCVIDLGSEDGALSSDNPRSATTQMEEINIDPRGWESWSFTARPHHASSTLDENQVAMRRPNIRDRSMSAIRITFAAPQVFVPKCHGRLVPHLITAPTCDGILIYGWYNLPVHFHPERKNSDVLVVCV